MVITKGISAIQRRVERCRTPSKGLESPICVRTTYGDRTRQI